MAQDKDIYEAVCKRDGHDLFVIANGGFNQALCKRCGTEMTIGKELAS